MSDKLSRKELKQPDAFQVAGAQASSWFQERQKAIAIAVAVVILGGLGIGLLSYLSDRGEVQAAKDMGEAMKPMSRQVDANAAAANTEEGQEPPFKSQTEKDQAIEKALSDFRHAHDGTRAATTAALPLAQAEFRLGKYDDALNGFEEFLKKAASEDPMRAAALEGKGYVYEAKKDYEKALTAFEQLGRENKSDFLAGMGPYHRARVLIEQGKKDDAAKELSQIPTQFPNTAAARMAQERLSSLIASGVAPPPPVAAAFDAGM